MERLPKKGDLLMCHYNGMGFENTLTVGKTYEVKDTYDYRPGIPCIIINKDNNQKTSFSIYPIESMHAKSYKTWFLLPEDINYEEAFGDLNESEEFEWVEDLIPEELPKRPPCSQFSGVLNQLCSNLNSLGYQLSNKAGLDMQSVIDKALESSKSPIPEHLKQKFIQGLRILYRTKKFDRDYIIKMKDVVDNSKLVYVNGEWHSVNKLNTNYSDLSELITDYLVRHHRDEISNIVSLFKSQNPKQVMAYIKPLLKGIENSFKVEDLMTYINNTVGNSNVGEIAELLINRLLRKNGITINYEGGNGDMIDMLFGVDTIADMKLIQTKASVKAVRGIKPHIDWIGVANNREGSAIFDREGNVVVYNGKKLCEGNLCNVNIGRN